MENNFEILSQGLMLQLNQVKEFIKNHNPTIGVLTEEILRQFLRQHLPKYVSVQQGFIRNQNGETSNQCDIIIYDSTKYAPFYRINDIVVVPIESVIVVIEVKTTITKQIFHSILDSFKRQKQKFYKPHLLFIYNSESISKIESYFTSYRKIHGEYTYDHDTYQWLPDEITGINQSYHLQQDYVDNGSDTYGYSSYFYENMEGTVINALQHFYLSLYGKIENYIEENSNTKYATKRDSHFNSKFNSYFAFPLFNI
ncbi:DUF6602 domain-containing protein [Parapedobacter indicus]|uniref:DUF6602 domain-containing protein n=1 Tax=Parapedobacter indicus TaxID=1477437 RepID=A0A1I3JD45_9SPHI|nr:DUF6602 domain-containing protein [Parapedobacter indicus]PPL02471.1 hypothetical protein CLV26_104401 [Parapedobacter indicus]SFI58134.1 hypothetical protein SAMN05444682_104400 [Parapedobacter indicus]